ncbi:MAG TPA: prepilin peptidase [Candidatus Acidoferrales bacterium]|nr:prepilin peptidase [Candidatus Acidoferrales bacterium]
MSADPTIQPRLVFLDPGRGKLLETNLAIGALFLVGVAVVSDVRSGRIPNWLTGGGLFAAVLFHACLKDWRGLDAALLGALAGGGVLFPFFLLRGIGAGDVKLLAAASAWVGIHRAGGMILATALAGGALAVGYAMVGGQLGSSFQRATQLIQFYLTGGILPRPDFDLHRSTSLRFPYSLAIATGTLYVVVSTSALIQR